MTGPAGSSAAGRKRAERDRRRKAGFVLRQIWVRPSDWPRVKRYLESIERPASRQSSRTRTSDPDRIKA